MQEGVEILGWKGMKCRKKRDKGIVVGGIVVGGRGRAKCISRI